MNGGHRPHGTPIKPRSNTISFDPDDFSSYKRKPRPTSVYQLPVTGYQQPVSGYQQPVTGYQQPVSGYQPHVSGCQTTVTGYQAPVSGYQQPVTGYQPPVSGYQPPISGYQPAGIPLTGYQRPANAYQRPASSAIPIVVKRDILSEFKHIGIIPSTNAGSDNQQKRATPPQEYKLSQQPGKSWMMYLLMMVHWGIRVFGYCGIRVLWYWGIGVLGMAWGYYLVYIRSFTSI